MLIARPRKTIFDNYRTIQDRGLVRRVHVEHRDLSRLPKAHLHVHLTGSIRGSTFTELGGTTVFPPRYSTWDQFVTTYAATKTVLRGPQDLHRLVVELVEDSAADGAVWTEVSVSPSGFHRRLTGSDEATMELVCDAVAAAHGRAGVVVGLDRVRDAEEPDALADLAVAWADRGVVGLGLAGDERAPCAPFARSAQIARGAGLQVVPHSGELCGPDSIREVLTVLRPDRLMHGVRAVDDPSLIAELADRGVCLDLCPTSNVALGVVAKLVEHPLAGFVRSGVHCSLNADNTLVFATDLAAEYRLARDPLGLSDVEMATLARSSLTASAAPDAVVTPALAEIDEWIGTSPGS